jgi:hypothetical protein
MKNGIELISEERSRQVLEERYTTAHDIEENYQGQLAFAAAAYACPPEADKAKGFKRTHLFPWDRRAWKPSADRIRELVKAGALIAAEIDRLQNKP